MPPEAISAALCAGTIFMLWSLIVFAIKRANYAKYVKSTGVILELVEQYDASTETALYAPRVTFEVSPGEKIQFLDPVYSSPPVAKVGERVEILFDPKSPKDATVKHWTNRHLGETVVFSIGLVITAICIITKLK